MNIDRFTHERKLNTKNPRMNLEEVATTLEISKATVRNWMKAGRIIAEEDVGVLSFNRGKILQLKHEIESGKDQRLKSRRNKRAVEGNEVPLEYVDSIEYIQVAEGILEILTQANSEIKPPLILFEIALGLLMDKKLIHLSPEHTLRDYGENDNPSLAELAIQKFLNLGSLEPILQELWDYTSLQSLEGSYLPILRAIRRLDIRWIRGDDLLGLIYMALSNLGERKSKGSYYTPTRLVDTLVQKSLSKIEEGRIPRVVDPCCGSGNFLIKLYLALVDRAERAGRTREEAEKEVLSTRLHGYDLDSVAVSLAKINLKLLQEASLSPHLNIQCKNGLKDYGSLFVLPDVESYDLVIGNPPWGYRFTIEEAEFYRQRFLSAETSPESFSLFIEYGLSLLSPGGFLAFVLPEAVLNVKTHNPIRKLLLENTKLLDIHFLGRQFSQVFTPTITLIAGRVLPQEGMQQENTPSDSPKDGDHQIKVERSNEVYFIPQRRFDENEMTIFNVKTSNGDEEILEQMRTLTGALFLVGQADFALGIVTGDNKKFVLHEQGDGAEPVLKGSDIFRYNAYPKENYLVFQPDKFQQTAPVGLYRAPEKLFYRFINENLVFAYDDSQRVSLNSANIVIPRLKGYSMKYVLAVLNSRAAQFFHSATFSSVKVLRKHIESIPIPPCNKTEQEHIVEGVNLLIGTQNTRERIQLYEQIDKQILRLYRLTSKQQALIQERFLVTKYL